MDVKTVAAIGTLVIRIFFPEIIWTFVTKKLDLSIHDAAEAIIKVANAKMAGAIRLISIERGYDPKKFAFMPFGILLGRQQHVEMQLGADTSVRPQSDYFK